jgi:hypothetical protein
LQKRCQIKVSPSHPFSFCGGGDDTHKIGQ